MTLVRVHIESLPFLNPVERFRRHRGCFPYLPNQDEQLQRGVSERSGDRETAQGYGCSSPEGHRRPGLRFVSQVFIISSFDFEMFGLTDEFCFIGKLESVNSNCVVKIHGISGMVHCVSDCSDMVRDKNGSSFSSSRTTFDKSLLHTPDYSRA